MATMNKTAVRAVGRAKTVLSQAKRKSEELATELAKKPAVRQALGGVTSSSSRPAELPIRMPRSIAGNALSRRR